MWRQVLAVMLGAFVVGAAPTSLGPEKQATLSNWSCEYFGNVANAEGELAGRERATNKASLGVKVISTGQCACSTRDVERCERPMLVVKRDGDSGAPRSGGSSRICRMVEERTCTRTVSYRTIQPGPPPMCSMADISGSFARADGMALSVKFGSAVVTADPAGRWTSGLPKVSDIAHREGCSFTARCHSLRMAGGQTLGTSDADCTMEFDKDSGQMTLSGAHGSFKRTSAPPLRTSPFLGEWRLADDWLARRTGLSASQRGRLQSCRMTIHERKNGDIGTGCGFGPQEGMGRIGAARIYEGDGQFGANDLGQLSCFDRADLSPSRCTLTAKGDRMVLTWNSDSPQFQATVEFVRAGNPPPPTGPVCDRGSMLGHYARADGMKVSVIMTPNPDENRGEVSRPAGAVWPRSIPKFSRIRQTSKTACTWSAQCHTLKRIGADNYTSTQEACTLTFDSATETMQASPSSHGRFKREGR